MAGDGEEVGVVADERGAGGQRGRHELVVVGVVGHHPRRLGRLDHLRLLQQQAQPFEVRLLTDRSGEDELVLAAEGGAEDCSQIECCLLRSNRPK
jgi:hypothetical protein